ncbi:MAG TPA: DUF2218 domain-containing protein [Steroidobacteraceae bacterium]|nr:DUF2218 domain-containing protein [Steroidobacteraceae bacterium]
MTRLQGEALTADAARVMRRLCRHWSHKFPVRFDDSSGEIQINDVKLALRVAPDRLHVSLENPTGEIPERLPGVVADHLIRMAGTEPPLQVTWGAAA